MKIFIGVTEIAGYYSNLKEGLDDLGHETLYISFYDHPFQYSSRSNAINKFIQYLHAKRQPDKFGFNRVIWKLLAFAGRLAIFFPVIAKYDVFIFGFGQSFFGNRELFLLKLFGKKIICFIGHGADARPPYLDGGILNVDGSLPTFEKYSRLVKEKRKNLERIEKYADCIISTQLTDHFLHRKFIPTFFLGIPYDKSNLVNQVDSGRDTVRILHSPSNKIVKGSEIIEAVIQNLVERGYRIEFVEISGKSNAVVMDELSRCDFVVDQLYSDTPLAGFACEAAWFGKPSIVGGYMWDELKKEIPPDLFPVSEICHPDDLEKTIEHLIIDKEYRQDLGRRARQFVEKQWNRRVVCERFEQIIRRTIPDSWLCSPYEHPTNIYGAGLSSDKARHLIRLMIKGGGVRALGLSDKPTVEQQLVEFANREND